MPDISRWYVWMTVFGIGMFGGATLGIAIVTMIRDALKGVAHEQPEPQFDGDDGLPDPDRDLIVPVEVSLNMAELKHLVAEWERKHGDKPERIIIERAWDLEGIEVVYLGLNPA